MIYHSTSLDNFCQAVWCRWRTRHSLDVPSSTNTIAVVFQQCSSNAAWSDVTSFVKDLPFLIPASRKTPSSHVKLVQLFIFHLFFQSGSLAKTVHHFSVASIRQGLQSKDLPHSYGQKYPSSKPRCERTHHCQMLLKVGCPFLPQKWNFDTKFNQALQISSSGKPEELQILLPLLDKTSWKGSNFRPWFWLSWWLSWQETRLGRVFDASACQCRKQWFMMTCVASFFTRAAKPDVLPSIAGAASVHGGPRLSFLLENCLAKKIFIVF